MQKPDANEPVMVAPCATCGSVEPVYFETGECGRCVSEWVGGVLFATLVTATGTSPRLDLADDLQERMNPEENRRYVLYAIPDFRLPTEAPDE